jgi:para-aminobenzoate synthetase component 1
MGWLGADGALDLAMVIRSVVFTDGVARIGTGGGITALSDPAREVDETELKARALLAVLGASATLPDGSA